MNEDQSIPYAIEGRTPYSSAIVTDNMVFISGQVPVTGNGVPDTISGQTEACLLKIKNILDKAGTSLQRVVKFNVYLINIADFASFNSAYIEFFRKNGIETDLPARATVGINALMDPSWKLEIDCIAVL